MAGGLTAATNNLFSSIENAPNSFGQGLQRGTNIRVANDQNKRAQKQSDLQNLKALSEIHGPKIKQLFATKPDEVEGYVQKIKDSNKDLVERMGLETFSASMEKKGDIQWRLTRRVDPEIRQDFKEKTGREYPGRDGDPLVMTVSDGDYTYETPSKGSGSGQGQKDFSPANITSMLNSYIGLMNGSVKDIDKATEKVLETIKKLKPDSAWLKKGKLDAIKKDVKKTNKIPSKENSAKKIGFLEKLFGGGEKITTASNTLPVSKKSETRQVTVEQFMKRPLKNSVIPHPKLGLVRFMGGDPDDQKNYEKFNK